MELLPSALTQATTMANRNRNQLSTDSSTLFPNNTSQLISPQDLRDWLTNGIDSFVTQKDISELENAIYENKANNIIAGATTDLSLANGNYVHIIGTTQITSFGTCPAGSRFVLVFDNAADILASANLVIPGVSSGNNKIAVPGDCCIIVSEGVGAWRIVGYFPSAGAGAGTVTSVSGTGSVNGLTLSGTVTTTGNLTLGGTLSGVDLASQVSGILPVANGGSGTATPSLVAGTNVSITGSWPNQTIDASGGGTPGGANTEFQYNNAGSFDGAAELTYSGGFVNIQSPKIGTSIGNGHLHLHRINTSAPNGITDYITLYADNSPKQIGARFETDAFTSALQFGATTDRTYTFPDASGNVVLDTATQNLSNKTLVTPTIDGIATIGNGASAGEIRLSEGTGGGSNYVAIKSPATLAANYSLTLPPDDGASAQILQTDGVGNLSWVNQSSVYRANTTAAGVVITGTTAKTKSLSILIPANSFGAGTILDFSVFGVRTAGNQNCSIRIEANTTDAIGGVLMATYTFTSVTVNLWAKVKREFIISNITTDTTGLLATLTGVVDDASQVVGAVSQITVNSINWTVDQYIVVSLQNGSTAESTYIRAMSILQR